MELIVIEMPTAKEMNIETQIARERIAKEREYQIQDGWRNLPNLIYFINQEIEKAKDLGHDSIGVNIGDCGFNTDNRLKIILDGEFTGEHAEYLQALYERLGFYCTVYSYANSSYRAGSIYISWNEVFIK